MNRYVRHFEKEIVAEQAFASRVVSLQRPRKRSELGSSQYSSKSSLGDDRLRDIRDILENGYTWTRSNTQRQFHESFLNACLAF